LANLIYSDQKEFLLRIFEEKLQKVPQATNMKVHRVMIGSPQRGQCVRVNLERNLRPLNPERDAQNESEAVEISMEPSGALA
jgi:hypothetical protein